MVEPADRSITRSTARNTSGGSRPAMRSVISPSLAHRLAVDDGACRNERCAERRRHQESAPQRRPGIDRGARQLGGHTADTATLADGVGRGRADLRKPGKNDVLAVGRLELDSGDAGPAARLRALRRRRSLTRRAERYFSTFVPSGNWGQCVERSPHVAKAMTFSPIERQPSLV